VSGDSRTDPLERRFRGELRRGAPSRGARTLAAILPNGRVVWLRLGPPLAPAVSLNHLAQAAENATRWRQAAAQHQSEAIDGLSRALAADAERFSDAKLERARALRRRMVVGDRRLDRRLARAREEHRSRVERQLRIERETVRRLGRRDLWDKIVVASSAPLFAAYGQPGRPFGANNVALTLSLLIWLVGDEIVDLLFGTGEKSPYPLRDTDAWSYIAPIGNLLSGWWLLDGLQHERFIAGFAKGSGEPFKADPNPAAPPGTELIYQYVAELKLSGAMRPEHFLDFATFTGVPVVATVRSVTPSAAGIAAATRVGGLSAAVDEGTLKATVTVFAQDLRVLPTDPIPSVLDDFEVAWMVDTAEPPKTAASSS
jgi:hypothetical protein